MEEANIGIMTWDACASCVYFEEDGSCPMDTLDLIIQGDKLICNLYLHRKG